MKTGGECGGVFLIKAPLVQLKKRIFKAFLEIAVLAKLSKSNKSSGYEVIKHFHTKFGISTSASTIYNILSKLEEDELVASELQSRIKVYSLTKKGERKLNQAKDNMNEIQDFIKTLLNTEITTNQQN